MVKKIKNLYESVKDVFLKTHIKTGLDGFAGGNLIGACIFGGIDYLNKNPKIYKSIEQVINSF